MFSDSFIITKTSIVSFLEFNWNFVLVNSTVSVLIHRCDSWFENMDEGELPNVVFFDVREAFDSLNHNILLKKLAFMV